MTLITCPECGKEISDQAQVCVNCGYPIAPEIQTSCDTSEAPSSSIETVASPKSKRKLVAILAAILACIIIVGTVIAIASLSLNSHEEYAYQIVRKYKSMLKDPDSMVLRGDILCVEGYEGSNYVIFKASGNNSYGASVVSMPMYKDGTYLGDYYDKPQLVLEDYGDYSEYLAWLDGEQVLLLWNLYGDKDNGKFDCKYAGLISGGKIALKIGCKHIDE